ncbi:MAG: DUF998 domain-containing protein [Pseudomonadota bacterium]
MRKLSKQLMTIGAIAPIAMGAPIVASFFASDYSWLSQHMSELQLRKDMFSAVVHGGAFIAGVALLAFAIGALLSGGIFTAITTLAFGAGMMANGIFPMGSPLHGLYGIAMFLILTPPIFVGEFQTASEPRWFRNYSYATAIASLVYMWILLVGLDPEAYSGLTQRIGTLISFVWYAVAASRVR